MYLQHFGLKEAPFSIAPDPRYLYMSERHQEALAHLLYGLRAGGGFVVLTGEVGAGKTTLCRRLLARVPDKLHVAYVLYPKLSVPELLHAVCDEFGVALPPGAGLKEGIDALNRFLLQAHAEGQDCVLVVDEAQNLSADVLEHLRLLTNLETDDAKLLQIVLIGQPELRAMLEHTALAPLAQRVIARYHLDALSPAETMRYVRHRLKVAGAPNDALFEPDALTQVARASRGVPRRINVLCDRALLATCVAQRASVSADDVERAAAEVFPGEVLPPRRRPWTVLATAGMLMAAALLAAVTWVSLDRRTVDAAPLAAHGVDPGTAQPEQARTPVGTQALSPAMADTAPSTARPDAPSLASAVTAATAPATLAWPETSTVPDEAERWRALAQLWGAPDPGADDPCTTLRRDGLWCHRATLTLAAIRRMDRPGLLILRDAADRPRPALLTRLDDQTATLQLDAGPPQRVSIAALAQAWRGEFATLWRAPAGYGGALGAGSAGPAVDRLATLLAAAEGRAAPAAGQVLDDALQARLRAFQVAHDLAPDALAGPATFMQLNRAGGVDEPRLGQPG